MKWLDFYCSNFDYWIYQCSFNAIYPRNRTSIECLLLSVHRHSSFICWLNGNSKVIWLQTNLKIKFQNAELHTYNSLVTINDNGTRNTYIFGEHSIDSNLARKCKIVSGCDRWSTSGGEFRLSFKTLFCVDKILEIACLRFGHIYCHQNTQYTHEIWLHL